MHDQTTRVACCMCGTLVQPTSSHALSCPHNAERGTSTWQGPLVRPRHTVRMPASVHNAIKRDALLEVTTNGEIDVTLLEDGAICKRRYVDEPAHAAEMIRAWQGPLTDRHARYSVRSR